MSCPSFPGCALSPIEADSIVGSAPNEDAYLVVETPKPWPAKVKKMEGLLNRLRSVLKKHAREDFKLLATPEIPWLEKSEQPHALLVRWNGQEALVETIEARPETLRSALESPPKGVPQDLYMVCTHGSRDPCCGLLGVPIFRKLVDISQRRVLQVSHLGGHRFAPVLVAFPEWRFFGHIKPEMCEELDSALDQGLAPKQGYRGHGRLPSHLQVVESELWSEHGTHLASVKQVSGDKRSGLVECRLQDGRVQHHRFELTNVEYMGYKSCKEFRKGKESRLKLPILASLSVVEHPSQTSVK